MNRETARLNRVRWWVRLILWLGILVSVVANVLHALPNPISQAIAAWPPLALFLTVELISRVPVNRRRLAFLRLASTALIAGIAAWVSYWHMRGVAERYGETGASGYLIPLTVDGLIVAASVCLVEVGGRITELAERLAAEAEAAERKAAEAEARAIARAARGTATVARPRPRPVNLAKAVEVPSSDEVAAHRHRREVAALKAECLRQGRILNRAEARAFLGIKGNRTQVVLNDVRRALNVPPRESKIPTEMMRKDAD